LWSLTKSNQNRQMVTCELCGKSDKSLKRHLTRCHPETSFYQYKKHAGLEVSDLEILMEKLQCRTQKDLAALLGGSRGGIIKSLKRNIHSGTTLQISYMIIAILLKRMPEPELKKSLREIRFVRDNE